MRQPVPFGKYLLLDRISVGGMAEVFKAKSYGVEGFEKIIAIKRILPTMGEDRDFIKMFIDEAKIAGQLAHANICQIFELGRIDGSHFIAMEYIWGKDLLQIQNRLRKLKTPMPVAMCCFIIAKVLEGLDYAHRKRDPLGRPLEIVHRDCSPQNVLVSYEGEVKVIDFGIAKATSRNSRTMAGVLKGKFGYMSPEQVRGLPLDRRSDIFAIGTMLYECLTSERLFQGETDFSTLEKVRNVDIQNPRAVNPAIPESVEKVILKALAKDVEERYQWCSEMLQDLQQFLMTQDQVFTAKSLSGWLKEVFTGEIDKERALLEQYKRVGRDGLIAGLPAAEAKLDVVEHLGEAPQIQESDATQLGGPNFEDMEAGMGAAPEVGPAPGSPAARGAQDDDRDGDFGEEAPTEIFGEIEHGKQPQVAQPPPGRPSAIPSIRGGAPPKTPPKPPPGRPGSVSGAPPIRAQSAPPVRQDQAPPQQPTFPQPPPAHTPSPQFQIGDGPPQGIGQPLPTGEQARTLMGQMAPAGLPNYSKGYPQQQPPGQQARPNTPPQGYEQPHQHTPPPQQQMQFDPFTGQPVHPSQPQMPQHQPMPMPMGMGMGMGGPSGQYPQQPQPYNQYGQSGQYPQQYPQHDQSGQYGQQGYPQQYPQNGFAHGSGSSPPQNPMTTTGRGPASAQELGVAKPEGRKKSSLGRDIAIGVVIAIVVLGGFLAVKFLILDKDDGPAPAPAAPSKIATLKISLPNGGEKATLFVDGKELGAFGDKGETMVNAGTHKVKLVRGADQCERELEFEGGKSAVFDCVMSKQDPGAGSAATGSGSATGETPKAGSGSALSPAAGSGSGSGSATQVAAIDPKDDKTTKTDPPKTDPPKTDPPKTDPPKTDPPKTDPKKDPPKTDPKTDPKKDPKTDPKKDKLPFEDKKPPTPPTTGDKGFLEIYSTKKAKILVDGVDTGLSTPITGKTLSLTPGKHKITFLVGEDRFTFPVTIKAGGTETMRKELQ